MSELATYEIPPESAESAVIVALHGRGSDPRDMAGLARTLRISTARWILPTAPIALGPGHTWYPLPYTDRSPENRTAFQRARDQLTELTRSLRDQSPDLPIIFLGFSQGGVLSLEMALRSPERIEGAVNLSGALYDESAAAEELADNALATPIFWGHGTRDSILPIAAARIQADFLKELGATITFIEYPMDHGISAEELEDVKRFLSGLPGDGRGGIGR